MYEMPIGGPGQDHSPLAARRFITPVAVEVCRTAIPREPFSKPPQISSPRLGPPPPGTAWMKKSLPLTTRTGGLGSSGGAAGGVGAAPAKFASPATTRQAHDDRNMA